MIGAFRALNPAFASALIDCSIQGNRGANQSQIHLAAWPDLKLTLQGTHGSPVFLKISPQNYWQFDAIEKGLAVANLCGDGGALAGQSILGLPLLNGYFTVFDRTAANGHGVINFATRT
jgi:hypothetical protein